MSVGVIVPQERKRVKVYELRNNDWFDRGTGFCCGQILATDHARILVVAEEDQNRTLLETRITKDDGYQKQQDTLIVWTEPSGTDMALSFQEPEGCQTIWDFVYEIQQRLIAMANAEDLEEDMTENGGPVMLPNPDLSNLDHVENTMRNASMTTPGRDALSKFVMNPEALYIPKLIPLIDMAEDLEDLADLHRLCNIMKMLILLNDTTIIEFIVRDEMILGVVGALEYDPDFPSHKANHRQYLASNSNFKEVVKFNHPDTLRKIHHTYRLQYLKDVVLARILDDPTFSVLNSLIYFHQVDIINHIQSNGIFLNELFTIFELPEYGEPKKKDAVLFIQQLCVIAKNIQAATRAQLFTSFINGGLFDVVNYALAHADASVRVAGSDILVALIDHDPAMMRTYIFRAINEKARPLTATLVDLLLVEQDLGVKTQMADAIKVLLDPTSSSTSIDMLGRTNGDFLAKMRNSQQVGPQTETFIQNFYDESAEKLFKPLMDLEGREDLSTLSFQEASLHEHLIGILCFFVRAHTARAKHFCVHRNMHARVAQLISCPQKHLKLAAIRWLRTFMTLGEDNAHARCIVGSGLLGAILDVLEQTSSRDSLLNSACLEAFEYIKRFASRHLLDLIVQTFRPRLEAITYVDLFEELLGKYDALQAGYNVSGDDTSFSTQPAETPNRTVANGAQRWAGLRDADSDQEAYFDGPDPEDQQDAARTKANGTQSGRPLVAYGDDDDDLDIPQAPLPAGPVLPSNSPADESPDQSTTLSTRAGSPKTTAPSQQPAYPPDPVRSSSGTAYPPDPAQSSPSERPSEKRRREEEEDDMMLSSLSSTGSTSSKRRSSTGPSSRSSKSPSPSPSGKENGSAVLRRKGSLRNKAELAASKVTGLGGISISLKSGGRRNSSDETKTNEEEKRG